MADVDTQVESICEEIIHRTPGEPEFHQAIREVAGSLGPVLEKHPEFVEEKIFERICEPDRQILFRVAWEDDEGRVHINRGFRIEFNSALGPYKGAYAFTPPSTSGLSSSSASSRYSRTASPTWALAVARAGRTLIPKASPTKR